MTSRYGAMVLLAALAAVTLDAGASSTSRGTTPVETPDVCDILAGQDLVFEGTLLRAVPVERGRKGGCGKKATSPEPWDDVDVRVDSILIGVAPAESVNVTTENLPRPLPIRGARVLVWANYDCSDSERLFGNMARIRASGALLLHGLPMKRTFRSKQGMTLSEIRACIAERTDRDAAQSFVGQRSVALLRVTRVVPDTAGRVEYRCESLGRLIGAELAAPRRLLTDRRSSCGDEVVAGDTLAVPYGSSHGNLPLPVRVCPRAYRVNLGFLPALGVVTSEIGSVLESTGSGFRLKSPGAAEHSK